MSAKIIDGKAIAADLQAQLALKIKNFMSTPQGRAPCLAVILVGSDPASTIYVNRKQKAASKIGITSKVIRLNNETEEHQLVAMIKDLNRDVSVDGILVQLPLPKHISTNNVIEAINPDKDVDGLTAHNQGLLALNLPGFVPCTPRGVMTLLEHTGVNLPGKIAAVIGRSRLVGSPIARLLTHAHATVIQIHSQTPYPHHLTRLADIVVAAAGNRGLVSQEWIKPGAIVIDVGIHRFGEKIVGDVNFYEVAKIASHISPVPGGVGPMTIASLLANTCQAYEKSHC